MNRGVDDVILGKLERAFVEPHVYRAPAVPAVPKRKGPEKKRTPALEARFRRLWADGSQIRHIAFELDLHRKTVMLWRKELGLPRRNLKRTAPIAVYLTAEMRDAASRRAFGRHSSVAEYVRALLRRDLGMPE